MITSLTQSTWPGCSWEVKMECCLVHTPCNSSLWFEGVFFSQAHWLEGVHLIYSTDWGVVFETEFLEFAHKEQENFSVNCDRIIYFFTYFHLQTSTFQQADYEMRSHLLLHSAVPWYTGRTKHGGSLLHESPMNSSTRYIKLPWKTNSFFPCHKNLLICHSGKDFYRSLVHQKYISSKTWPNLASYPSQSSFGNRKSRYLPKAASCWREVKHLSWLLALWLMESGRAGIAAALPSGSLWEGVAGGYYSQAKQWSGGHQTILPGSWLQEQKFQLLCTLPCPTPLLLAFLFRCAPTTLHPLSCGERILTSGKSLLALATTLEKAFNFRKNI